MLQEISLCLATNYHGFKYKFSAYIKYDSLSKESCNCKLIYKY